MQEQVFYLLKCFWTKTFSHNQKGTDLSKICKNKYFFEQIFLNKLQGQVFYLNKICLHSQLLPARCPSKTRIRCIQLATIQIQIQVQIQILIQIWIKMNIQTQVRIQIQIWQKFQYQYSLFISILDVLIITGNKYLSFLTAMKLLWQKFHVEIISSF